MTGTRVSAAVAQILSGDGEVAGAGFLIAGDLVVTCAHVVRAAGRGPGDQVSVAFPNADRSPRFTGAVLTEPWRAPEAEDIAVLRLDGTPTGVGPLPLGSAKRCRGHQVRVFGFPRRAPSTGHFGYATAGDLLTTAAGPLLQLTGANDLTTGFSGGPVFDEMTGRVVGMVTAISAPDEHLRGTGIAYATPTAALREAWPELVTQDVSPYRHLQPFTAQDARWFYGREAAVERVLTGLAGLGTQRRLLLLLGPSGAGKSSLVQAGLLPKLAGGGLPGSARWLPVVVRPGQDLAGALEQAGLPGAATVGIAGAARRRLAADPRRDRVLLVIDQFEELLAQHRPRGVLDQLLEAARATVALSLVLVMRDDFYSRLAALAPDLLEAVGPGLLNVPASLSRQDLYAIITRPADEAGARYEDGLPERIITDVLAADPAGATTGTAPVTLLAPLELTLTQLWDDPDNDDDGHLTHTAYQRLGEVAGALATWCNTALQQLDPARQPVAQRILTALVRPADDARNIPAARQQVSLTVLRDLAAGTHEPDGRVIDDVLDLLIRQRIITTGRARDPGGPTGASGEPVAELVHDALIRDWADLRNWVAQDHLFHDWLRRAQEQRTRWTASGLPGDLLDGTDLAAGLDWATQRRLPAGVAAFLAASEAAQRAERERERASNRQLKRRLTAAVTALALALVAGGLAVRLNAAAQDKSREAQRNSRAAQIRQLEEAARADLTSDPQAALYVAIAAHRMAPGDPTTRSTLIDVLTSTQFSGAVDTRIASGAPLSYSPDGRTLVVGGGQGNAELFDADGPGLPHRTAGVATRERSFGFVATWTGDSVMMLTGANGHLARFSLADRTRPKPLRDQSLAPGLEHAGFSTRGKLLVTAPLGNTREGPRLWAVSPDSRPARSLTTFPLRPSSAETMTFSPDDRLLALGWEDGLVELWNVADPAEPRRLAALQGTGGPPRAAAFSPDGKTLAVASNDAQARLWDLADPSRPRRAAVISGHGGPLTSVAYSRDGRYLATGSTDRTAVLWDVSDHEQPVRTAVLTGDVVEGIAFSRDGRTVVTGAPNGRLYFWAVSDRGLTPVRLRRVTPVRPTHYRAGWMRVPTHALDPHGRMLALLTGDHELSLIPLTGSSAGRTAAVIPVDSRHLSPVGLFSRDGKRLALPTDDGTVTVWDVSDPAEPRQRNVLKTGVPDSLPQLSFSPDNRQLAVQAGRKPPTFLWDVSRPGQPVRLARIPYRSSSFGVLFAPRGNLLALGTSLYSTADPHSPERLATLPDPEGSNFFMGMPEAFTEDVKTLLVGSFARSAQLYDVSSPAHPHPLASLTGTDDLDDAYALSSDGRLLATAGSTNQVLLWDVSNPSSPHRIVGLDLGERLRELAISADGSTLTTYDDSHTVTVWNTASLTAALRDPGRRACRLAGENPDKERWDVIAPNVPFMRVCQELPPAPSPEPFPLPDPFPSAITAGP
ncbi:trypsin-like peptidase domain-containing protein [Streptomyces sp. NPDC051286]|uniref:nSTAND1 domain-containing NTPase n=1 Tax=Streptomyces sp. NPDC051286 TaxID=3365647 RepID=UPI0037B3A7B8